jgi:leader peptidase (prepilin peptidase)/N-methyltransferase
LAEARAIGSGGIVARRQLPRHRAAVAPVAAGVAGLAFVSLPFGPTAFIAAFLSGVLVVVAAIDLERRIIPNRIVLPAMAVMLIARVAFSPGRTLEWFAATLIAGAVLLLPRIANPAAMGMGDVKLAMLIGAALGWGVLVALPVAFACVLPVALFVVASRGAAARKTPLPFGPFMALGALFVVFIPYVFGSTAG